jgi:hypothetical protein
MRKKLLSLSIIVCVVINFANAQVLEQKPYSPKKLAIVIGTETALYGSALAVLWGVWYKDYEHTSFHFYNDNKGWMQIDKAGHCFSAYTESYWGLKAMRWAGVKDKKAILYGGGLGFVMQTPIEILDGLSAKWGASWGDLIANTAGSGIVIGQELLWHEQRIKMKFSFSRSAYWKDLPEILGDSYAENFLDDYNGHTYWFTFNLQKLTHSNKISSWLTVAVGYGAGGMLNEYKNPYFWNGRFLPERTRHRQFYLSLDIDLTEIKTRSKFLKGVFAVVNTLKVPLPTLEYNKANGFVAHTFYF